MIEGEGTKRIVIKNGERVEEEILDPYERLKREKPHLKGAILKTGLKKMAKMMADCISLKQVKGIEAPIGIGDIPKGTILIDKERIIMNQEDAENRAIDSDGDRGIVISRHGWAILIKHPITRPLEAMKVIKEKNIKLYKIISDISETFEKTRTKIDKEMFRKMHKVLDIGIKDRYWSIKDLYETRMLPFQERIKELCADPGRFMDIEKKGLKSVRALWNTEEEKTERTFPFRPDRITELILLGRKRIKEKSAKALEAMLKANPIKEIERIRNLEIDFVKNEKADFQQAPGTTGIHKVYDPKLYEKLKKLKVIRVKEIKGEVEGIPPACIVWAERNGKPVLLFDSKRPEATYYSVLYPLWSGRRQKWIHPEEILKAELSRIDLRSRNGWPRREEDIEGARAGILTRTLLEIVGKYGDLVFKSPRKETQIEIIKNTVSVLYTSPDPNRMLKEIEPIKDLISPAAKGAKEERLYKYMLKRWTERHYNERRATLMRAQLIQSPGKVKLTTAIANLNVHQSFITPQGIEKVNTIKPKAIWKLSQTPMEGEGWKEIIAQHLDGTMQVYWVAPPEKGTSVRKLITQGGLKTFPIPIGRRTTKEGTTIDIIVPLAEIKDKGCFELVEETPRTETLEEKKVMITEIEFYVSGVPGENIPARIRTLKEKGFPVFPIIAGLEKIGIHPKWVDIPEEKILTLQEELRRVKEESLLMEENHAGERENDWEYYGDFNA